MNTKVEEAVTADGGLEPIEEVAVYVSRRGEEGQVMHYPPAGEYVTLAAAHKRMAAMNTEIVRGHALTTGYEEALTRAEAHIAQQDATIARMREALEACIDYGSMTDDGWVTDKARAALTQEQVK